MSENDSKPSPDLAEQLLLIRQNRPFMQALRTLLDQAQAEVKALGSTCLGGGCCCRFDLYGHRLYVTLGELALLAEPPLPDLSPAATGRCPWQRGPRCLAHARRPLGCRVFFCDTKTTAAQNTLTEKHLAGIKKLCQDHGLPYVYADLTALAAQLSAAIDPNPKIRVIFR